MKKRKPVRNRFLKALLLAVAWLSVLLGVLGIFLPLLPTTPFLLLAAACFLRTSPRFYDWLINHPRLGKYVYYYLDGKGIPLKAKVYTVITIWVTMSVSWWLVSATIPRVILPLIGLGVTFYILRQPTLALSPASVHREEPNTNQTSQSGCSRQDQNLQ